MGACPRPPQAARLEQVLASLHQGLRAVTVELEPLHA